MMDKLKRQLGISGDQEDDLLADLLDGARDTVLDTIGRDNLPVRLESAVVALAAVAYNRRGTEGETSHNEGGVSASMIDGLPGEIRSRLLNYPRKVRVMGVED